MPTTEKHPLTPFLPQNAKILMLGSFPPPKARWSMEFFYPNRINDMWRIWGYIFYGEKRYFETADGKGFRRDEIIDFCTARGIALYDTASEVRRLKENAADKFLEIVTPTDIGALLHSMPLCNAIVTTGEKASESVAMWAGCKVPPVGCMETITIGDRELHFWRMPSSSRAYPLALEKKAEFYRKMAIAEGAM